MRQEEPGTLDRRALLRRMAIGGAALWAAPSFHSVASAQAQPSCGPGLLDWDTFTTGSTFSSTVVGSTTVNMTITGVTNTTLLPNNGRVLNGPAGGVNEKHLRFEMTPTNGDFTNGSRQTVTFTFSNPVSFVQFTFFDIDNLLNAWGDRLVMNTAGYTWSRPPGSNVVGNGSDTTSTANNNGRFRSSNLNNNPTGNDNTGNLTITYTGPISQFSFTYRNQANTGGQNQLISMSDISFLC